MTMLPNSVALAVELIAQRRFGELGHKAASLLYEKRSTFGLKRDLRIDISHPKAKIPITVRKLHATDIPSLLPPAATLARQERVELATRKSHFDANIPQCYVAVDDRNGAPCYFQWLMGPSQNARIQALFGPQWFPILRPDEALLENAYTPPAYRGNGIMSEAMALIAERAEDLGCRYVITFVEYGNIPSLKGCTRAGFSPHMTRTEKRVFHRIRMRTFSGLPQDMTSQPAAAQPAMGP